MSNRGWKSRLRDSRKNEVRVYTEFGKLYVEGKKEESKDAGEFVHKGLAQRSFTRDLDTLR